MIGFDVWCLKFEVVNLEFIVTGFDVKHKTLNVKQRL